MKWEVLHKWNYTGLKMLLFIWCVLSGEIRPIYSK